MRKLVQVFSLLGALLLGPSGLYSAHREALGRHNAELGSVADPAYWGLKKGEYIPGENCWIRYGKTKYPYETCVTITYLEEK